jgi:hypothetical protein
MSAKCPKFPVQNEYFYYLNDTSPHSNNYSNMEIKSPVKNNVIENEYDEIVYSNLDQADPIYHTIQDRKLSHNLFPYTSSGSNINYSYVSSGYNSSQEQSFNIDCSKLLYSHFKHITPCSSESDLSSYDSSDFRSSVSCRLNYELDSEINEHPKSSPFPKVNTSFIANIKRINSVTKNITSYESDYENVNPISPISKSTKLNSITHLSPKEYSIKDVLDNLRDLEQNLDNSLDKLTQKSRRLSEKFSTKDDDYLCDKEVDFYLNQRQEEYIYHHNVQNVQYYNNVKVCVSKHEHLV